jgi:hypothetical protein
VGKQLFTVSRQHRNISVIALKAISWLYQPNLHIFQAINSGVVNGAERKLGSYEWLRLKKINEHKVFP